MARKTAETKKENNFIEFEYTGKEFKYTGRVYPDLKKTVGKLDITPVNFTLNGVITIKGCRLMQTDSNAWLSGPQYKSGDEYKDFVYIERKFNDSEIAELVKVIESKL